ncbi:MAG: hypothetical protein CO189_06405 [candidate division Zixibacteria bacterium CG_4_9_14_3_um_filter_46_8]|nr:MAG: hypothetical protein CO189_06405 [candidate division Zixibacteria bacterium CG_4_9_14_3_um_filter_46_8]
MTASKFKNKKIRDFLVRIENHLRTMARQELKRRHSRLMIENLSDIIEGKNREHWLLDDRFQSLRSWFALEGNRLLDYGLSEHELQKITAELEKLKGFTMARWYRESDSKNSSLRRQFDGTIHLAHNYIKDAASKLNLEFTPMGLMKANRPFVDNSEYRKIVDANRREYIKWLEHQLEILKDLYDPSISLANILADEIHNMRKKGDVRDKMLVSNILHFFKIRHHKDSPCHARQGHISDTDNEIILKD